MTHTNSIKAGQPKPKKRIWELWRPAYFTEESAYQFGEVVSLLGNFGLRKYMHIAAPETLRVTYIDQRQYTGMRKQSSTPKGLHRRLDQCVEAQASGLRQKLIVATDKIELRRPPKPEANRSPYLRAHITPQELPDVAEMVNAASKEAQLESFPPSQIEIIFGRVDVGSSWREQINAQLCTYKLGAFVLGPLQHGSSMSQ